MARAAIAVFATNIGIQVVGDSCVVVKQLGPWTCIMCVVFFFCSLEAVSQSVTREFAYQTFDIVG